MVFYIMVIKEEILKLLEEGDKTISQMAHRLKYNENSIRTIINRDLKSQNIIIETNAYQQKFKIYTLNSPENQYRHLANIVMYRDMVFSRINESFIKIKTWYNIIEEYKKQWGTFLKYTSDKNIRKNINKYTKQLNELSRYMILVDSYRVRHKNILNNLRLQFKNIIVAKKNNVSFQVDLKLIFYLDSALEEIINDFIKWEKSSKQFFEKLSTK